MSVVASEESVVEEPTLPSSSSVLKVSLTQLDGNRLIQHPMMVYTIDGNVADDSVVCCMECDPEFADICIKPQTRKKRSLRKPCPNPCAKPKRTCKPKPKPKAKPKITCKRKVKPKKTCAKRKPKACPKSR